MKSKDELIDYMSSNVEPFHAKDLASAERILLGLAKNDPFYRSIKEYVDMIQAAKIWKRIVS